MLPTLALLVILETNLTKVFLRKLLQMAVHMILEAEIHSSTCLLKKGIIPLYYNGRIVSILLGKPKQVVHKTTWIFILPPIMVLPGLAITGITWAAIL